MADLIYLQNVTTLILDEEKCVGCGMCLVVCPHAVMAPLDGRVVVARRDACMECGACARNCPVEAIHVEAGVGCAQAVINAALGRQPSSCCCALKPQDGAAEPDCTAPQSGRADCC